MKAKLTFSMKNKNIVPGTQYQFDLTDLAVVGKNDLGIALCYKQGLVMQIDIDDPVDREKQYIEICKFHMNKNPTKVVNKDEL